MAQRRASAAQYTAVFVPADRRWLDQIRLQYAVLLRTQGSDWTAPLFSGLFAGLFAGAVVIWQFPKLLAVSGGWFSYAWFMWLHAASTKWGVAGGIAALVMAVGLGEMRWRGRRLRGAIAGLDRDLALGLAVVDRFEVEAVKVLREAEQGVSILCLRLSDGQILVVDDDGSPDEVGVEPHHGIEVRRSLTIWRYAVSGVERFEFGGEVIPLPPAIALTGGREVPDHLEVLAVDWDQIEAWAAGAKTLPSLRGR